MKVLYLECNMGAAGDMLAAALLELLDNRDEILCTLNHLGLEGVKAELKPEEKCGIAGSRFQVTIHGQEEESLDVPGQGETLGENPHKHFGAMPPGKNEGTSSGHAHHSHGTLHTITQVIASLPVSQQVKDKALAVYGLLAQAEAHAHGRSVEEIHFHEVGTLDAIVDIVCVCMAMEQLAPDQILVSPIHVGAGQVRCAHGIMPVPAPATAYLLRDVPIYGGQVMAELCTPTGAALLKYFADGFGSMPSIRLKRTGYGMGKKSFPAANCVRAHWGETVAQEADEEIVELACNLDDMTPEAIGFAQEVLWDAGALDVYTTAIGMKKSRPGCMLSCLCRKFQAKEMAQLLLQHTTTLGVREYACRRYVLHRETQTRQTAYGPVRLKTAFDGAIRKTKAEYEDVVKLAREQKLTFAQAKILAEESEPS